MAEHPEYICCPKCETKMKIDYSQRMPETDGIFNIYLRSPACIFSKKTTKKYFWVSICNNCKTILGLSQSD